MWAQAEYDGNLGDEHAEMGSNICNTGMVYLDSAKQVELRRDYRAQLHAALDALCDKFPEVMDGGHFYKVIIA